MTKRKFYSGLIAAVYSIMVIGGIKLLITGFIKYPYIMWHFVLLLFGVLVFRSVYKYLKDDQ